MNILVTGGSGFIGSNLVLKLQELGNNVTVIDNLLSGNLKNLEGFKGKVIKEDISKIELNSIFDNQKFDAIFHLASITDTTFVDGKEMMRANVDGFKNILNFAKKLKVRLIYSSSAGIYGRGNVPMNEAQEPQPLNAYALSKKTMDDLAKEEMKQDNILVVGLRYFNVYGPHEEYKGKSASMIYQLFLQMKQGKAPKIFKYGEQKRDFIYIKDLIEAHLKSLTAQKSCIVNVGTGVSNSFNKVIEVLNHNLGTEYKCEYFDNPYGFFQEDTQADTRLAFECLGFKARFSIEEGIKDYISYLVKK